ncbi:MAG: hypothetical protein PQ612_00235 [Rickettsiales bacterium]|nr:hypothetical protein [Pseudomonadota bacterium]MDA0965656.1 hypothetical protein [Pseudomonadota bacterium]MDG4542980.1 hypothetical protein [Rickettsiales bacterium]MDG4544572.1 hypothetical protein [Rickettsiales bacterium]MDG4546694.1 hypothetical protein [Rickettsiales bacterium]
MKINMRIEIYTQTYKKRMVTLLSICTFVCAGILGRSASADTDLNKVIESLYGGDGITLTISGGFNHAAHFTSASLNEFAQLSRAAQDSAVTTSSGGGGTEFVYDEITGEFTSVANAQGGVFTEHAGTLGKGRLNLGASYTYTKYTHYNGQSLNGVRLTLAHVDLAEPNICIGGPAGACYEFERDYIQVDTEIDLTNHVLALYGSYGITDKLDFGVLVPIIHTRLIAKANATFIENETKQFFPGTIHSFDPAVDPTYSTADGEYTSVGDFSLRAKYALYSGDQTQLASVLEVRFPTGDANNLQGIDYYGAKPMLLASRSFPFETFGFGLHANVGYEFNAGYLGQDEFDYVVGAEYYRQFTNDRMLSLSIEAIGSHELTRKDGSGDHTTDLAFGLRLKTAKDLFIEYGMKYALDKHGIRASRVHQLALKMNL